MKTFAYYTMLKKIQDHAVEHQWTPEGVKMVDRAQYHPNHHPEGSSKKYTIEIFGTDDQNGTTVCHHFCSTCLLGDNADLN